MGDTIADAFERIGLGYIKLDVSSCYARLVDAATIGSDRSASDTADRSTRHPTAGEPGNPDVGAFITFHPESLSANSTEIRVVTSNALVIGLLEVERPGRPTRGSDSAGQADAPRRSESRGQSDPIPPPAAVAPSNGNWVHLLPELLSGILLRMFEKIVSCISADIPSGQGRIDSLARGIRNGGCDYRFSIQRSGAAIFVEVVLEEHAEDEGAVPPQDGSSRRKSFLPQPVSRRSSSAVSDVLREVTLALTSKLALDEVLDEILRQIRRLVPYTACNIALVDETTMRTVRWAGYRVHDTEEFRRILTVPRERSPIEDRALREGTPILIRNTKKEMEWVQYPQMEWIRSFIGLPLLSRGEPIGILRLDAESPDRFTAADVDVLLPFAAAAAVAVENARMYERTREAVREKEVLAQEIHHRVKNNLAIIASLMRLPAASSQGQLSAGESAVLLALRKRIESIALVHDKLHRTQELRTVQFRSYVEELVERITEGLQVGVTPIEIHCDVDDIGIDVDVAVPVGLLVNELVTNALKYAFPQLADAEREVPAKITVSYARGSGFDLLTVSDNGVGLPVEIAKRASSAASGPSGMSGESPGRPSLGTTLVRSLVSQLRGSLEVRSEAGTSYSIRIPHAVSRK